VVSQSWTSGVSREVVGGAAARKIAVAMRGRERSGRGRIEPPDAGVFSMDSWRVANLFLGVGGIE